MPDEKKEKKSLTMSGGALYIQKDDGTTEKVADMDLVEAKIEEPKKARQGTYMRIVATRNPVFDEPLSFTFRFTTYRESLSLIYGFKVTNNWLKMHGGIMERRCGKRKRPPQYTKRKRMKRRDLKRKKRKPDEVWRKKAANLAYMRSGGYWQTGSLAGLVSLYPPSYGCGPAAWRTI